VVPTNVPVITIGPTTSANAVALGLSVYAEARRPGLDGILEMIP
jgi:uroporphyrinogen-III synthase